MGTQKLFSLAKLKTHFNFVNCGCLRGFLYREMIRIGKFLWVLVHNFLLFLFGFLDRYLHRLEADEYFGNYNSGCVVDQSDEKDEIFRSDLHRKRENFKLFLKEKTEESIFEEKFLPVPNASKYEINSREGFSGVVEEPKAKSFTVEEFFVESKDDSIGENGIEENRDSLAYSEAGSWEKCQEEGKLLMVENDRIFNQIDHSDGLGELNLEAVEKTKDSVPMYSGESDFKNLEKVISSESGFEEEMETENTGSGLCEFRFSLSNLELESSDYAKKEKTEDSAQVSSEETDLENEEIVIPREKNLLGCKEIEKGDSGEFLFSLKNSGMEYSDPAQGFSIVSQKFHPIPHDEENYLSVHKKLMNAEELIMDYLKHPDGESDNDFIELDPNLRYPTEEKGNISRKSEELSSEKEKRGSIYDIDDDDFDILLQHQESIEKMKMEMKNSKMKGLPTILENCESFKLGEDLKPLKIDEKKLEHKDRVDEIQKVYKSYLEKMRKLDILNYQTLNAINFMQLKDPNQQGLGQKSSSSAIKSLWPFKLRRVHADPTLKSIFEMHKNLETVYVGQLCLSWETLRWEYEKVKELLECDTEGLRSYNSVAGEFQHFQVLVLRFVENEQYLGPRVPNYSKNRCELRVLLQVPVIKEDCPKEKRVNGIEGEYEISISMLLDIIDETMHVFWEFLRADHKDDKFPNLKGLLPNHLDLQDPSDSELLMEIKTNLQMTEKRLKDILRTGNCIVKKFQKQHEGRTDLDLIFAQIDLKLVSRVLNMSRLTTDQLIWCQNKLLKVKFNNKKVHVEPSFLLFPF